MRQKRADGMTTSHIEATNPDDTDKQAEDYFVKYAEAGSPFDIATDEDDKEEDVMDTSRVRGHCDFLKVILKALYCPAICSDSPQYDLTNGSH